MRIIHNGGVLLTSAALIVLTGGLATAQKSIESTNVSGTPNATTSTFAKKAAEGGLLEVQLGQLAEQKASSQQVKQFGQRMVTDHTKLNDQLMSVASKDNIPLPTQLTGKDKAQYDRLAALSGTQFDRAYMRYMVKDHTEDISEFQKEANSGSNPDLKSLAGMALPILQQHLQLAKDTQNSLGVTSRR